MPCTAPCVPSIVIDLHVTGRVAGRLQGGDGAERHLVVVGVDGVDVGIVGDQLLGDRLASRPLVVGRLLSDDLDVVVARGSLARGPP